MEDNISPIVTVVTITYNLINANRKETFLQAVESVKNQDYPYIEHLIIDGASNDGTLELIQSTGIKYISEPDTGLYDAMNKGARLAKGKYLIYLHSDDFYHDTRGIAECVKALEENNADFVAGNTYCIDDNKACYNRTMYTHFQGFLSDMPCNHPAFMCKTELLRQYPFDTNFKIAADYDFIAGLLIRKYKGVALNFTFVTFRAGGTSTDRQKALLENYKVIQKQIAYLNSQNTNTPFSMTDKEIAYMQKKKIIPQQLKALCKDIFLANQARTQARFTIITICKDIITQNSQQLLLKTLESIKAQQYPQIEHILCYQNSNDITLEFLHSLKSTFNIQIIESSYTNTFKSMQEAITIAKGDNIHYLPVGAYYLDTHFLADIAHIFMHSHYVYAMCSDILYVENTTNSPKNYNYATAIKKSEIVEQDIHTSAFFYRKSLFREVKLPEVDDTLLSPWLFHCQAFVQDGYPFIYYKKPLVCIPKDTLFYQEEKSILEKQYSYIQNTYKKYIDTFSQAELIYHSYKIKILKNFTLFKIKENIHTKKYLLFKLIPLWKTKK